MNHRLALFKYPGGKSKRVELLLKYLGPHLTTASSFHEVFVGGGPLLLYVSSLFPHLSLFANDLDPTVAAFWSVLADPDDGQFEELCAKLDIVPDIDIFNQERATSFDPTRSLIQKAFHCVFFHKTTFSGMYGASPIGGKNQTGDWKVGCHYTPSKFVPKIREARRRVLGRLTVSSVPTQEYLHGFDGQGAVVYADPPYYKAGPALYAVSMDDAQHRELESALAGVTCPWVLSYDNHPVIRELYKSYRICEEPFRYSSASFRKEKTWTEKVELIILPKEVVMSTESTVPAVPTPVKRNRVGRPRKVKLSPLEELRIRLKSLIERKTVLKAELEAAEADILTLTEEYRVGRDKEDAFLNAV